MSNEVKDPTAADYFGRRIIAPMEPGESLHVSKQTIYEVFDTPEIFKAWLTEKMPELRLSECDLTWKVSYPTTDEREILRYAPR